MSSLFKYNKQKKNKKWDNKIRNLIPKNYNCCTNLQQGKFEWFYYISKTFFETLEKRQIQTIFIKELYSHTYFVLYKLISKLRNKN